MLAAGAFLSQGMQREVRMLPSERQKVLDENAHWQAEIIEAFSICPFAKHCRETGRLHREVLEATAEALPDALSAMIVAMHRRTDPVTTIPEIALALCPNAQLDARAFERLVRQCGDRADALVREDGLDPQYYVVAFHPEMAFSDADPYKLVGFWRRSPHPTVQFVHIASLDRIRGTQVPPKYVDPTDQAAVQALLGQPVSGDLADRIALANWRTYHAQPEVFLQKSAQLLTTSNDS